MCEELEDLFPSSSGTQPTPVNFPVPVAASPEVVVPEVVGVGSAVNTAPEAHSDLGPSRYTMWAECPCFEGQKDQGEYAARGSAAHEILSRKLNNLEADRPKDMGIEEYNAAEWGYLAITGLAKGAPVVSEGRVAFNPPEDEDEDVALLNGVFGTVDAWWIDPNSGSLNIADFKTFDRGEKDHTPQLSGYAVLLCSNHPEFAELPIMMHVVCGGIHKVVTYRSDFATALNLVISIIKGHLDPKAEPMFCDSCKYCAKRGTCNAAGEAVQAIQTPLIWNSLSDCEKLRVLSSIKKLVESEDERIKAEIDKHGGTLEDKSCGIRWVRKYKRPTAVCSDMTDLLIDLTNHGVPEDKALEACTLSKKKVSELLCEYNKGFRQGDCDKVIDMHWVTPSTGVGAKYYTMETINAA